jgi:RNA polymerase sigma-70 factor (ECF subfamily)
MSAVAAGRVAAFDEIVRRHQAEVWRIAYRCVGDGAEAEDITQSTFLRVLQAAARYRPTASFRTYLFQIATRLCLDHARKARPLFTGDPPDRADEARTAEAGLVAGERERRVHAALTALPGQQRIALILRHFEGMSYADVAAALGTSPKAVERLLARGRETLRARLHDLGS